MSSWWAMASTMLRLARAYWHRHWSRTDGYQLGNIVLMKSDPTDVARAIELSKATSEISTESLLGALL